MPPIELDLSTQVHRRYNPLTGESVLVSPHRTQRPWQGQVETMPTDAVASHDANCYLCPGNVRASGDRNPAYDQCFVFDNDFAALHPAVAPATFERGTLIRAASESGLCRVICYSPRHDLHLAQLPVPQVRAVIDTWADQYAELALRPDINAVQIFENRGPMMGASNPHPHGQIWGNLTLPPVLATEAQRQQTHYDAHNTCLLCDYTQQELRLGERVLFAGPDFVVLVPFWATWPFETLVLPTSHVGSLDQLSHSARDELATSLQKLTHAYDKLFSCPFPYTSGWHQKPADGNPHPAFHLHAHFLPPLLRSATVRKFMVGYEMLAGAQRDITAETAAAQLRAML
jgi:UDPglucose--hexose-1-phosphate uridylyltransferase